MNDYKNTIFLPKTAFAMKANLSSLEPLLIEKWHKIKLYSKLRHQRKGNEKFILHWGPPYANGHLHIGHAFNGILKDIITRSYSMLGYDAPLVPGWDCHGLPIEWKIEEQFRKQGKRKEEVDPQKFRQECRLFANKWIKVQKEEFKRLAICADMDNAYITMDFQSEAFISQALLDFASRGYLYQGVKPVMWSPIEKTSMAEAELEYKDKKSLAIYVKFKIINTNKDFLKGAYCLIWTTTPWTIPGNRAIAYHQDKEYVLLQINDEKYVVASSLVQNIVSAIAATEYKILQTFSGNELSATICNHPFVHQGYDFAVPLIFSDHVTTETGTGLVHTAPGHGPDDFALGKKYNLAIADVINDDAVYAEEVKHFAGIHIFKADSAVIALLQATQSLLHMREIIHSYPHSWRSKAPLIFRTTPQWFINIDHNAMRKTALDNIQLTRWLPGSGINRITAMVKERPDWCISRQRSWGVPLTLFVHKQSGNILIDQEVNAKIISSITQEGCEAWFMNNDQELLGCKYNAKDYHKVTDVLDVWFDSGATQTFVLEKHPDLQRPADVYVEGSDQHRGWFQSSLLIGCALRGNAPYKTVVTHGFACDEAKNKMSKSSGNVISPLDIAQEMGMEILRLWVVSCDYTDDLTCGKNILKHQQDIYRRYRNTLRYLLGALNEYDKNTSIAYEKLPLLEKWILHRIFILNQSFITATKQLDFHNFYNELHNFCSIDLSAFYFDIRKDSLYCDAINNSQRNAALFIINKLFVYLVHWLAPLLPCTAEEAYQAYNNKSLAEMDFSVHLNTLPEVDNAWEQEALAKRFAEIRKYRSLINAKLEESRKNNVIGSSLQACITINDPNNLLNKDIDWSELLIVSQFNINNSPINNLSNSDIGIQIQSATGNKCSRCWKVLPEVEHSLDKDLCARCVDVVV